MILKDAEENGELCLDGFQLINRERGNHRPEYADQEKTWGEKGIFCQLHSQFI